MNKITSLLLSVFVLLVAVGSVSAAPLTMISGTITDADNAPVSGANVDVDCNGNVESTTTDANGNYYVFYLPADCDAGDSVNVEVSKDNAEGTDNGTVAYDGKCKINTSIIDVQIPEFGVIAASVAMIGAVAGLVVLRKRN